MKREEILLRARRTAAGELARWTPVGVVGAERVLENCMDSINAALTVIEQSLELGVNEVDFSEMLATLHRRLRDERRGSSSALPLRDRNGS